MDKDIVYRVEDGMDREKILCTTYQMRNFYMQFRDGFFTNLDVMNYIQHLAAAHMAKKGHECAGCVLRPLSDAPCCCATTQRILHPIPA